MPDTPEMREKWAEGLKQEDWWDFVNVPEMSEADAKLIVRCVNHHAALLEALQRCHGWLQGSEPHRAKYIGEVIAKVAETQGRDLEAGAKSIKVYDPLEWTGDPP